MCVVFFMWVASWVGFVVDVSGAMRQSKELRGMAKEGLWCEN